MIAADFKPVIKSSMARIKPEALALAQPLLDSLAMTTAAVRKRVAETGKAGRGTFSKYSAKSNKRGPKRFYRTGTMWDSLRVRLQNPTRATAGFSGKAADGFARKKDSTGKSVIKRNKRGRYTRLGNIDLGRILQSKERADIMGPTPQETNDLQALMRGALSEQAIRALGFEDLSFRMERRARSLERRAKKARRELGGRR